MATLNFNVGVLGHIDSGKTSLAKALSTVASTACFDKNPQSRERGITLDLGFSSFTVEVGKEDAAAELRANGYDFIQYTLVDCPGHASLIKTIIGGAQIIDMMLLVVDIQKGMQTQTAECLIIGEITCNKMIVVLNKLDMIEESKRASVVDKMTKRMLKTLESTKFAGSRVIAIAANPNAHGSKCSSTDESQRELEKLSLTDAAGAKSDLINVDLLIDALRSATFVPTRRESVSSSSSSSSSLLFSVDHCFTIRGQGTIMTGTVLNGIVKVNDNVEIPTLKMQKKVKSIQVFRKPVDRALAGDRCGVCLANFDSKAFERGMVCSPGYLKYAYAVIVKLNRIRYYKGTIESGARFHVTIGHDTLLGRVELFEGADLRPPTSSIDSHTPFNFNDDYLHVSEQSVDDAAALAKRDRVLYALIDFSHEATGGGVDVSTSGGVLCVEDSLLIGSKLDTDINLNQCRIAFYGRVCHQFTNRDFKDLHAKASLSSSSTSTPASVVAGSGTSLADLRVYKMKSKEGAVDRKHDEQTVIGRSLFKKETNIEMFVGLKVHLSTGEVGIIEGGFGQSGKFKVRIPEGLLASTKEMLDSGVKSKQQAKKNNTPAQQVDSTVDNSSSSSITAISANNNAPIKIKLNFKRYIYDEKKRMIQ